MSICFNVYCFYIPRDLWILREAFAFQLFKQNILSDKKKIFSREFLYLKKLITESIMFKQRIQFLPDSLQLSLNSLYRWFRFVNFLWEVASDGWMKIVGTTFNPLDDSTLIDAWRRSHKTLIRRGNDSRFNRNKIMPVLRFNQGNSFSKRRH